MSPSAAVPDAPGDVAAQVRALLPAPLPLPGEGRTRERWSALTAAARADVVVGRLLEAHADADAILAELTGARVAPDQWWGVWAAEPPTPVVDAERTPTGWVLSGTKPWCSGAGLCTHALVTVRVGGDRPLFGVNLDHPGVSVDLSGWAAAGMRRSATGAVSFDRVPAEPVGAPADYLQRPGFWHGGAGVAACWLGGAEKVADTLRRAGPRLDDHGAAHLGAVDAALAAARWSLLAAAAEVDDRPADVDAAMVRTARIRAVVEAAAVQTVDRVGRALGAAPLATDPSHTEAVSDLLVYLRQSHAERDLAGLGRLVAGR
jgi:alkylation response protein AidB-like acyl-CoA dehydrogenase